MGIPQLLAGWAAARVHIVSHILGFKPPKAVYTVCAGEPDGRHDQVGFVSAGIPGTLTEAVSTSDGQNWLLAPLPA
jgi:hypothetical protein